MSNQKLNNLFQDLLTEMNSWKLGQTPMLMSEANYKEILEYSRLAEEAEKKRKEDLETYGIFI